MPERPSKCAECDAELTNRATRGRPRLYCGDPCRRAADLRRTNERNTWRRRIKCTVCGVRYQANSVSQLYCGKECRYAATAARRRANTPERPRCRDCGGSMVGRPPMAFYCKPCSKAHEYAEQQRSKGHTHRRRMQPGAVFVEFDTRSVFMRDNWTCQICDEKVDPELRYPDPLSASLDHIVPLSKGGDHSQDNSQLAHLVCNFRKGNRGQPAQAARGEAQTG